MDVLVITRCISILQDIRKHNSIWFWLPNKLDRQQIHRQANAIPNLVVGVSHVSMCVVEARARADITQTPSDTSWLPRRDMDQQVEELLDRRHGRHGRHGFIMGHWDAQGFFAELPWHEFQSCHMLPQYPEPFNYFNYSTWMHSTSLISLQTHRSFRHMPPMSRAEPRFFENSEAWALIQQVTLHCFVAGCGLAKNLGMKRPSSVRVVRYSIFTYMTHTHTHIYTHCVCIYIYICTTRIPDMYCI